MSRFTRLRRGAAMLAATAVASAGLTALATAPAHSVEIEVADAELRWGISNEANNSAFAPGTFNFFSAGKIGDPAAGGQQITHPSAGASWSNGAAAGWSATSGNVTIEKEQADGSYATATWAGTRTSSTGGSLGSPTVQTFSDHQVVIDNGTGTVDPEANTAEITWDGDFTVVFYSGMSFFYVSDPVLTVNADGTGAITATGSGFASSQLDTEVWEPVPDTEVTLATLTDVEITDDGFITTPDYLGVEYDAGEGSPQVAKSPTNEAHWGSFPQSFVDFAALTGAGPYWYSSGGAVDPNKPALPLEVSYSLPVPAPPAVTVSSTVANPDGTTTVTVAGTGFDPALATGARPPLAGKPAGAYVAFGKYADTWKPSALAPSANRVNLASQLKWAVPAASMQTVGGPAAGAIELTPEGTFTAQLTLDKAALDALVDTKANKADLVNYGIFTYPGSGATQALYETYTPITFDGVAPVVTLDGPGTVEAGDTAAFTVSVDDGSAAVEYRLANGEWTPVVDGAFSVADLALGTYTVEVRAIDAVGNEGTDSLGFEVEDTVNPVVTVSGPTSVPEAAPATYTVSVDDASEITAVEYRIDSGEWVDVVSGTFTVPGDVVGTYAIEVRASDAAENIGSTTLSLKVTYPAVFTDVAGNTFAEEIAWLAGAGVTTGYDNPTGGVSFRPSDAVLREQMAAFLYRYTNGSNPPGDAPRATFVDVPTAHVFSPHIKWLADQKITTGYAGNLFRPGQPVLREQMAAFLYRVAGEPEFTAPATSPFADVPTSHTFYREITWLASTKVTTGYTEGGVTTFKGSQPVLREQMAAFLYRFDDLEK